MTLVFQYGSNTSSERLNHNNRLRGDAKDLGLVYTQENYELDFNVWSNSNDCAASDIKQGGGRKIWGVLYNVPDHLIDRSTSGDRKSFDAIEGNHYERSTILVCWPDGSPVEGDVITYTVREPQTDLKTSLDYVSHIIAGLREHNAPVEYIEYAKERIVSNNPELASKIQPL
jgi:hypothetical protein